MNEPYKFLSGARGPDAVLTIRRNKMPINLTGCTVTLTVRKVGASTNKFSRSGVINAEPTTGIVTFSWLATDWDAVGTYKGQLTITDSGGKKTDYDQLLAFIISERW